MNFLFRSTAAPSYTPAAQSGYAYNAAATQRATGYDQSGYQAQSYASKNIYNISYPSTYNSNPILATAQTYEYGYGRPAQTYDAKNYYQAGASYGVPTTYDSSATVTANKGAATTYAQPTRTTIQQKPTQYSSAYATAPTTANTAKQQNTANAAASYSSYDSALYSAATGIYMAQQQQTQNKVVNQGGQNQQQGAWGNQKRNNAFKPRNKPTPKPQQIHYCDVCKISCAGPQTYREHLEGQKHKKREALQKAQAEAAQSATAQNTTQQATPIATQSRGSNLRCELCDVTCTGNDAYSAHVRGSKHQKVVKLHTKLGKPIPSSEPTPLGGGVTKEGKDGEDPDTPVEDVKPVGEEYIEEMKDAEGKIVTFNCKLCDCKFNDPNAKEMHTKGRRHRLQYKKKVQPDLVVDVKPTLRQRKLAEREKQRQAMQEELWNRRRGINEGEMDDDERMYWDERRRYEEEMNGGPPGGNWNNPNFPMRGRPMGGYPPMFNMMNNRRVETLDDRHVIARHAEIYPKEEELQGIQKIVSHTERALKLVSDAMTTEIKKEEKMEETTPAETKPEEPKSGENKENGNNQNNMISFQKDTEGTIRLLKGVMRVGLLAKGND